MAAKAPIHTPIFGTTPALEATAIFAFVRAVFFAAFTRARLAVPDGFSESRLTRPVPVAASVSNDLGRSFRGFGG
jgi:hypothetical protein